MAMILYALLVALASADGLTTYKIIQAGGYEKNPVVRWLIEKMGLVPALVWSRLAVFAAGYLLTLPVAGWYGAAILAVLCAAFGWTVKNNLAVMKRQKSG